MRQVFVGSKSLDLIGKRFSKLVVLQQYGGDNYGHIRWQCRCDCGNFTYQTTDHLTRKKNPVMSCGCNRKRKAEDNPSWKGYKGISGSWWVQHVKKSARAYRIKKVSITIEQAWELFEKQKGICALSGIEISFKKKTASLDRIDSSKDYELGNIQWVHKHVNLMKNKLDQDYFIDLCRKIGK